MLISKEELENLERYEDSQARRSSQSLQTVLMAAFEGRESRENPENENVPPKHRLTSEDFKSAAERLGVSTENFEQTETGVFLYFLDNRETAYTRLYSFLEKLSRMDTSQASTNDSGKFCGVGPFNDTV